MPLTIFIILVIFTGIMIVSVLTIIKHKGIGFLYPGSPIVVNTFAHYITLISVASLLCLAMVLMVITVCGIFFYTFSSYTLW